MKTIKVMKIVDNETMTKIVKWQNKKWLYKKNKNTHQQDVIDFFVRNNVPHTMTSCVVKKNYILFPYSEGTPLIEFDNKNMNIGWWKNILLQICDFCIALQELKCCHNDFWDNNIIVKNDGQILVIDYETVTCSGLIPDQVKSANVNEKHRMGWSTRFRIGSDMNQIMGLMTNYKSCPLKFKKFIKHRLYVDQEKEFPYAIHYANKDLSPFVVKAYVERFMK